MYIYQLHQKKIKIEEDLLIVKKKKNCCKLLVLRTSFSCREEPAFFAFRRATFRAFLLAFLPAPGTVDVVVAGSVIVVFFCYCRGSKKLEM